MCFNTVYLECMQLYLKELDGVATKERMYYGALINNEL